MLPNKECYGESCAAIASMLWQHRMFLALGESRYMDVLERVLYNGFLSSVGLSGDRFLYVNPLASDGRFLFNWDRERRGKFTSLQREPWHYCPCCPPNLCRYVDAKAEPVMFNVNGRSVETPQKKGYAVIRRTWRNGDTLRWEFPMPIRRVLAHEAVKDDTRRWGVCAEAIPRHRAVAVERGPIVYCFEGVDNEGRMGHKFLPPRAKLSAKHRDDLLGGVTVVEAVAKACFQNARGGVEVRPSSMTAIPYYAWNHRGVGEMNVWVPQGAEAAKPLPAPATGR